MEREGTHWLHLCLVSSHSVKEIACVMIVTTDSCWLILILMTFSLHSRSHKYKKVIIFSYYLAKSSFWCEWNSQCCCDILVWGSWSLLKGDSLPFVIPLLNCITPVFGVLRLPRDCSLMLVGNTFTFCQGDRNTGKLKLWLFFFLMIFANMEFSCFCSCFSKSVYPSVHLHGLTLLAYLSTKFFHTCLCSKHHWPLPLCTIFWLLSQEQVS